MKKVIFLLVGVLLAIFTIAQGPQAFKYQSLVRDNAGNLLTSQNVSFRMSIIRGPIPGLVVYTEIHVVLANAFGLANLEIGRGTPAIGSFAMIDWSASPFYLKTEVDIMGGSSFVDMGTSELLSVPYAFYTDAAISSFELKDSDGDTKVQVEKNPDEDIIRFDMNGQEYW
ncbi:MAG: hypothetical protein FJY10_02285 [Bacteroidetes bacterium]|nr:hypothetical protein [Bacteroidota bacterium]